MYKHTTADLATYYVKPETMEPAYEQQWLDKLTALGDGAIVWASPGCLAAHLLAKQERGETPTKTEMDLFDAMIHFQMAAMALNDSLAAYKAEQAK